MMPPVHHEPEKRPGQPGRMTKPTNFHHLIYTKLAAVLSRHKSQLLMWIAIFLGPCSLPALRHDIWLAKTDIRVHPVIRSPVIRAQRMRLYNGANMHVLIETTNRRIVKLFYFCPQVPACFERKS